MTDIIDSLMAWDTRRQASMRAREFDARAAASKARRCGNCEHWMKKSACGREAYSKPAADDYGCNRFALTRAAHDLSERFAAEARAALAKALPPNPAEDAA